MIKNKNQILMILTVLFLGEIVFAMQRNVPLERVVEPLSHQNKLKGRWVPKEQYNQAEQTNRIKDFSFKGDVSIPPFPVKEVAHNCEEFATGSGMDLSLEQVKKTYFNGFFKDGWVRSDDADKIDRVIRRSLEDEQLNTFFYWCGKPILKRSLKAAGLDQFDEVFKISEQLGSRGITPLDLHREVYYSSSAWGSIHGKTLDETKSIRNRVYGEVMAVLVPAMDQHQAFHSLVNKRPNRRRVR